jgi:hypothetical protein
MSMSDAANIVVRYIVKYAVMKAGGQMIVPMNELMPDGMHVRMFIDNANEAIILTVVTEESMENQANILQI